MALDLKSRFKIFQYLKDITMVTLHGTIFNTEYTFYSCILILFLFGFTTHQHEFASQLYNLNHYSIVFHQKKVRKQALVSFLLYKYHFRVVYCYCTYIKYAKCSVLPVKITIQSTRKCSSVLNVRQVVCAHAQFLS